MCSVRYQAFGDSPVPVIKIAEKMKYKPNGRFCFMLKVLLLSAAVDHVILTSSRKKVYLFLLLVGSDGPHWIIPVCILLFLFLFYLFSIWL
ncbi:hypothetical protein Hanom_Chr01g00035661 [Helianthus anomalus]